MGAFEWRLYPLRRAAWLWVGLAGALLVLGPAIAPAGAAPAARLAVVRSDDTGVDLVLDTPLAAVGRRAADLGPAIDIHGEGFGPAALDGGLPERGVLVGVPAGVTVRIETATSGVVPLAKFSNAVPAGGSLPSAAITDEAWLRDLRTVRVVLRPLTAAGDGRSLSLRRRITVRLRFEGEPRLVRPRPDPHWQRAYARLIANWPAADRWRVPGGEVPAAAPNPLAATGAWKVAVDSPGWQSLRASILVLSGLPPGSNPKNVRLFDNNVEIPLHIEGGEDGRLDGSDEVAFYGRPVDTRYTGTNTYWLTVDTGEVGARIGLRSAKPGSGARPEAFTDTLRVEQENLYDPLSASAPGDDRFYWRRLVTGAGPLSATHEITFSLSGLTSGPAAVRLRLKGADGAAHRVRLSLNDTLITDRPWSGTAALVVEVPLADGAGLVPGENRLVVDAVGSGPDAFFIDWLEVDYPHDLDARGGAVEFVADVEAAYQVIGLPDNAILVLDVTDPEASVLLDDVLIAGVGPYVVRFAAQAGHRYHVTPRAARHNPPVALDTPADLVSPRGGADLIILAHLDFRITAVLLRGLRFGEGFRVRIVDVEDAYDTYSDGEPDPAAIRDLVAGAYAGWSAPAPSYVVLVGDGHFDYRHFVSDSPWYVPPYMADLGPGLGEAAMDNAFVTVSGPDILPDLAVGRLVVNDRAAANAAADRVRDYELAPAAPWQDRAVLVADDGPTAAPVDEEFAALADDVARALPSRFTAQHITLGDADYPSAESVRGAVAGAIGAGQALVGYLGMGRYEQWAAEGVWRGEEIAGLANADLPVVLELTGRTGDFARPRSRSLAELFVDRDAGGAVAAWSATGTYEGVGHEIAGRAWLRAVYEDGYRGGAGAVVAKAALFAAAPERSELIQTLTWFGDPALAIAGTEPHDPPSPTPLPSPGATPTFTPTVPPTTSATATATPTLLPTASATLTTPAGTAAATATATITPTPSLASPTPTASAVATATPGPSPTASATSVTTPTHTPSPTDGAPGTAVASRTPPPYIPGEGSAVYLPIGFRQ